MIYADPDFGFLFLKSGWQLARKELLRAPVTAAAIASASEWVDQARVSEDFQRFAEPFASPNPLASFEEEKADVLARLTHSTGKVLKYTLGELRFYREYLALFPERFFHPFPAVHFSEALVKALRCDPLDLRQDLYFRGPTRAYEFDHDFFCYAVSPDFAKAIATELPKLLRGQEPHDLALLVSLTQACATGAVEVLVYDE